MTGERERPGTERPRLPAGRLAGWILAFAVAGFLLGYGVVALGMYATAPHREIATVPDVRRARLDSARDAVRRADLKLEIGDSLPNPQVPAGSVLAQSPLPGGEVAPGSAVRVIVSTGPERRQIPTVGVLTAEQATSTLQAMGFTVRVEQVTSPREAGRVVGTLPAAGTPVSVPSEVKLLVSLGPPRVAAPRLEGLPQDQAVALLEAAGLELGAVEQEYHPELEAGVVLSQRPAAGDSVRQGSSVDVVVSTRDFAGPSPIEIH